MSPDTAEGIRVTLLGMGLEFIILGIILVAMVVLERLFRRPQEGVQELVPEAAEAPMTAPPPPEGEVVAAISIALAQAELERKKPA